MVWDFSRPLNQKERAAAQSRLARLNGAFGKSAERATAAVRTFGGRPERLIQAGYRLRGEFVVLTDPPASDFSDRRVPPRELRPPATKISSSQGATLRLLLVGLAIAQMMGAPGQRAKLDLPVPGNMNEDSWSDLIATKASESRTTTGYYVPKDKRARSVNKSLATLKAAGLMSVTKHGSRHLVSLLDESGRSTATEPQPYSVPQPEGTVALPGEFITEGWVHVLEDSETNVLLMIACRWGGFRDDDGTAFPGVLRLQNYGISRDNYTRALKMLDHFGLVSVVERGRRDDGRAYEEEGQVLHRLALRPDGFKVDALSTVIQALQTQLAR